MILECVICSSKTNKPIFCSCCKMVWQSQHSYEEHSYVWDYNECFKETLCLFAYWSVNTACYFLLKIARCCSYCLDFVARFATSLLAPSLQPLKAVGICWSECVPYHLPTQRRRNSNSPKSAQPIISQPQKYPHMIKYIINIFYGQCIIFLLRRGATATAP